MKKACPVVPCLKPGDEFTHEAWGPRKVCDIRYETADEISINEIASDKYAGWLHYKCGGGIMSFKKTPEGILLEKCTDFIAAE